MATPAATTAPLSPSEIVLLNGERFTGYSKGFAKWNSAVLQLPAGEGTAKATDLGFAVIAAAVLGAADAGGIRLATGEKKALLGLRKVRTVFVTPGDAHAPWAEGTLEGRSRALAAAAAAQNRPFEVDALVAALIVRDSTDAWHEAVQRVQEALHARGLLTVVEERQFKVFKVSRYVATEDAVRLARNPSSVASVQALLEHAQAKDPEMWALLVKEVQEAVRRRTERDHGPDFD